MFSDALPLVRAVDVLDPLAALRALAWLPHPFLLHSSLADERSRWSFFGADPFKVHRGTDPEAAVAAWRRLAPRGRGDGSGSGAVPFTGGAVGYWSYDYGRRLERLPSIAEDDLGLPDYLIGFYDVIGAYDHRTRQAWLFSSGLPLDDDQRRDHAERRLDKFMWMFSSARVNVAPPTPFERFGQVPSTFTHDGYRHAIENVKDLIARGDIFQANLSQRWTLKLDHEDPTALALPVFASLASRSPAPFAAYFGANDHAVVSASPERFLELRSGRVETRPIKGTRPRGADAVEDGRLREELLASAKDRAENVMIVDVLRNDLGRVCEAGTVRAPRLCELEAFPQVFHLVSTVNGTLREEVDAFDLLHACFPGGSITGAPKIRAMEILDEIEPVRRHIYTGSVGYVDWSGDADWNIAIRTALVTPNAIHFAAGGGITADSDPDEEYAETLVKAEGLRAALSQVLGHVALEPGPIHA